jgi:hypothetical protein
MLFGVRPQTPHKPPEASALDLIFVGGRDAARIAESYRLHPFLLRLPELALCHLKVRNSVENIRSNWMMEMAQREQWLRDKLSECQDLPKSNYPKTQKLITFLMKLVTLGFWGSFKKYHELLARNNEIAKRQEKLVDTVVHVKAELRTMRTNRDTFKAACTRPFQRVAGQLKRILIDHWMHGTELQAENDIGYAEGAIRLARTHFRSVDATAEAEEAQALRRIHMWLIFLTVVQVVIGIVTIYVELHSRSAHPPATPPPAPKAEAKP